jgi:MFS family permease
MTDNEQSGKGQPLAKLPRNVWAVTATSFLTDVSSEMVFNVLPLYLLNVLGVRTASIGLIEGVAESAASLLKVASGWLSDRLGARKWMAVSGYGVSTLAKPFLVLARTWPAVLLVRFVDRVGKGIRTAPRDSLVAASVSEARRGLAFGLHRAGDTAGAAVGILIAWWVVRGLQSGSLELTGPTFRSLVLLSIIPAALAVLVLAVGAREVRAVSSPSTVLQLSISGLSPRFRWFLLAVGLFTLGNSADAFLILRAQSIGMGVDRVLLVILLFNVVYALTSGPAGGWSDRVGRFRLLVGGWVFYALVYLGFAAVGRAWQVFALMAAYGLYYGLTEGVARALVADLVSAGQRGTAYGVYHTVVGTLALPASLLAGLLWQGAGGWPGFGPSAPFLFGSIVAVAATGMLMWARRQPAATVIPAGV